MEELRARTTLFCGVIVFAIAASVLLRGRRLVHVLFAAFATCVAAWYASQALVDLLAGQAPIWMRVTAVLTVLLPQFAVHVFEETIAAEPTESGPSKLQKIATACGVPMLIVALSPYHGRPVSVFVTYCYVLGLLAAALVRLWQRGRASASRAVRDRVRFLVGTGALATAFTLADFLSYLHVYLPPIGAVIATVFLFVLAESLQRQRLADLYELSGRLLVSTTLAFSLAGIFYVAIIYLGRYGAMYLNAVLVAIVFLVVVEPLRTTIERRMHQFFFRERYVLEVSIAELRRKLAHAMEMNEIVTVLMNGLEQSRRVTTAALYLRDPDGFELIGSWGQDPPRRLEALALRPLLDQLQSSVVLEELLRTEAVDPDGPLATAAATLAVLRLGVIVPVRGEDEELIGLVCVADDRVRDAFTPEEVSLLDSLAAQLGVAIGNTRVYAKLQERDRLAALGAMAAGLAHEVKNPLGAIKGAAQLLEEVGAPDPAARDFLGIILEETDRLNRVVGSFLDYARPHAGNPVPLDVNSAVKRTIQILAGGIGEGGPEIDLQLADKLPYASIDAEQLRQVLINLVQNAMHAMSGQGRVTVATDLRPASRSFGTSGGDAIEIRVTDTGSGMTPKVLSNLFVPFFTTKEQGTGLGLAISHRIIQSVGGRVEVQSEPGKGTTVTIVLPAAREKMLSSPPPSETSISVLGS